MLKRLVLAVCVLGVLAGILAGLRLIARSRTTQLFGAMVSRGDTSERVVALTFDDGPTAPVIDDLLSVLASRGVRATFFVNGVHLAEVPEVARRLVAEGLA